MPSPALSGGSLPAIRFAAVVAAGDNGVIGHEGQLPWRMKSDLQRFRRITMGHAIIMGRRTLESIGRILPGRTTIVLTRQPAWRFEGAIVARSVDDVDRLTREDPLPMVVGGGEVYRLFWPWIREIFLTRVHASPPGDVGLPEVDWHGWELVRSEELPAGPGDEFASTFSHWRRQRTG